MKGGGPDEAYSHVFEVGYVMIKEIRKNYLSKVALVHQEKCRVDASDYLWNSYWEL